MGTEGLIMTPQAAQAVQMVTPTTTTAPIPIRNSVEEHGALDLPLPRVVTLRVQK